MKKLILFMVLVLGIGVNAFGVDYVLNGNTYNLPTCNGGSWSTSGGNNNKTYTCAGSFTLNSGDTITTTRTRATVIANAGFTVTGSTIGSSGKPVNLQTTYGTATITSSTLNGSLQTSSGAVNVTGSTINSGITSSGASTLNSSTISGDVSSNNGVTTDGTNITGTVTASSGTVNLKNGTIGGSVSSSGGDGIALENINVTGNVMSSCCSVSTNGGSITGNISAGGSGFTSVNTNITATTIEAPNNTVNITGGTISGAISTSGGSGVILSGVTMTSGSITTNGVAVAISSSNLGNNTTPITISSGNEVNVTNNSYLYSNITAPDWSPYNPTIIKDASSTIIGICTPNYGNPCTTPTPTPIADYRFDECYWSSADDEVKDSSGNNLNAKAYNGADTTKDGKICRGGSFDNDMAEKNSLEELLAKLKDLIDDIICWLFGLLIDCDGVTDAIVYADDNDILDITSAITVMGWVAIRDDDGVFLSKYEDESNLFSTTKKGYSLGLANNRLQWTTDSDTLSSTTDITQNQWVHIAVTYDGNTKKIYIDGNEDNSKLYSGGISANDSGLMMGYINGYMDEIKIFDSALTEQDIKNIVTLENDKKNIDGSTRLCNPACDDNGPTIHYSFEDCTVGETVTNVIDSSGGENHATGYPSANSGLQCINTHCGKGVTFDGIDDYIKSNNNFSFTYEEGFTVISTFKFNWTTYRSWLLFFGMSDAGTDECNNNGMHWLINTRSEGDCGRLGKGMIQFGPFCGTQNRYNIFSPTDYEDIFVTMATVYEKSTKKLTTYLNGVAISEKTSNNDPISGNAPVFIGKPWNNCSQDSYFKGVMDDLKIFNRTLSRDDIISYTCSEPRGSFRFDVCEQNQQNKIYTKVTGQNFDLKISSLDVDTDTETPFTGTVCLRKVDMINNTQTPWQPFVFNAQANQLINENISIASRNLRYDIAWEEKDTPENSCLFADTTANKAWSDNFSIRPAAYNFNDISHTENPRADKAIEINLDATAVGVSDIKTDDYNTTNFDKNISVNVIVPEDGNCPVLNPSTSYGFIPTDGNFSDGVLQNDLNLSIADVGEYNATLKISDTSWTSVDSLTGDCVPDSNSTLPDANGKVGCNISSSKEFKIKVYPHHFDVDLDGKQSYINPNSSIGVIYYGQGMDDNLSTTYLEQNITITAQSESNATTQNYDANCFAPQDTKLDINISLENINNYPLMIAYSFSDDGTTYSSPTITSGAKKFILDANDSNSSYNSGVSQAFLRMSLDVNKSLHGGINTPINPMKLDGSSTDNNISVTAIMSDDGVDVNGSSDANLSFGTDVTYYFGRLTPIDAQTRDDNVSVTFYVDVYCDSNCDNYNLSSKSMKYPANWYVNTNEDNLTIQGSSLSTDETNKPNITINNNGKGTANFAKNDSTFYGKAKVDIDLKDSNQTFIYYNPYSDTNITRFYIDFLKDPEGELDIDGVIDNQGKSSESGRRLRW